MTNNNNNPLTVFVLMMTTIAYVIGIKANETIDYSRYPLFGYKKSVQKPEQCTTDSGSPVDSLTASMTCGPWGPFVVQDVNTIELLSRFDRERIPERVVHAKGAGAKGYFEVTHNITNYTKAVIFSTIGKRTNIAIRFSQVTGEAGSSDTVRDVRGFAVKFYTEDGIFDLVGNNTPIFFIRDAILFPAFIHILKRNPATHLHDANAFWDFLTLRPESVHQLLILFSDRGIPDGYPHMHGYGSNTFKLVNKQGQAVYCKFHFKTDQGIRNLPVDVANNLTSTDPDYLIRDLYNTIHQGNYPSWTAYIQVMELDQVQDNIDIAFDVTKIWPKDKFPLIEFGKFYLTENHRNYFSGVEQIAFSPAHMIPGIEPSPDKVLQGRLFSYTDTHYYRLGTNHWQLPINYPHNKVNNYNRDGDCIEQNQGGAVNYFPNTYKGPIMDPTAAQTPFVVSGQVKRYETGNDDNYSQAQNLYRNIMTKDERERLADNIAGNAINALPSIQERVVALFTKVDAKLGARLTLKLGLDLVGRNAEDILTR